MSYHITSLNAPTLGSFDSGTTNSKHLYNNIWLVVWWPFLEFSHILGMSSSQLTFFFFQRGGPTTNQTLSTIAFWEHGRPYSGTKMEAQKLLPKWKNGCHCDTLLGDQIFRCVTPLWFSRGATPSRAQPLQTACL